MTLTLNRPHEQNNLTPETLYELRDITAYLRSRKDVWAVIVQGEGKSFSIGLDVRMIHDRLDSPEQPNREFLLGLQGCLDEFEALEKPTISELSNPAWVAIDTVVDEYIVRDLIPKLRNAGAKGIVEYPLNKII